MKVKDLKKVTNTNVRLIFFDRNTREQIDTENMCGYDYREFKERTIYMIYPSNIINTLDVHLY